jgi:hypothetical protein
MVATEEDKRFQDSTYLPLHAVSMEIKEVKSDKRDKHGKRIRSSKSYYTSFLTGRTQTSKPSFVAVVENSDPQQESAGEEYDEYGHEDEDEDAIYD